MCSTKKTSSSSKSLIAKPIGILESTALLVAFYLFVLFVVRKPSMNTVHIILKSVWQHVYLSSRTVCASVFNKANLICIYKSPFVSEVQTWCCLLVIFVRMAFPLNFIETGLWSWKIWDVAVNLNEVNKSLKKGKCYAMFTALFSLERLLWCQSWKCGAYWKIMLQKVLSSLYT